MKNLNIDGGPMFDLAPLGHLDALEDTLAARFDLLDGNGDPLTYVIEYRHPDRWDSGIGGDVVLVHEVRQNGLSYLKGSLTAGQQYVSPNYGFIIEVKQIDTGNLRASVVAGRMAYIWLDGSVTTTSKKQVGSGTLHFPGFLSCPAGDFEYTHQEQVQSANYTVRSELLDENTVQYDWFLDSTLLSSAANNVALLVYSSFPLPLETGGSSSIREIVITYTITNNSIFLKTRPEDGDYSVTLRVHAHDAGGRNVWALVELDFEGDIVEFGRDYYQQVEACMENLKRRQKLHRTKPKPIPRGGDPGLHAAAKRKIAQAIRDIVQADPRLAGDLRRVFGHIHGVSLGHGLRKTKKAKKPKKVTGT